TADEPTQLASSHTTTRRSSSTNKEAHYSPRDPGTLRSGHTTKAMAEGTPWAIPPTVAGAKNAPPTRTSPKSPIRVIIVSSLRVTERNADGSSASRARRVLCVDHGQDAPTVRIRDRGCVKHCVSVVRACASHQPGHEVDHPAGHG